MTATAEAALNAVSTCARTHQDPETRVVTDDSEETGLCFGTIIHQGDVYLTRMPVDTDFGEGLVEIEVGRITPRPDVGAEDTVGSQHIIQPGRGVRMFKLPNASPLQGPIVIAPEGFYLSHPKHGDVDCRLPGAYVVEYQRDLTAEGIARRQD